MNRDKFVIFLFGCVILFGGWFITTKCNAGHHTAIHVNSRERCYEVNPGVYKCYGGDGGTRTITKI